MLTYILILLCLPPLCAVLALAAGFGNNILHWLHRLTATAVGVCVALMAKSFNPAVPYVDDYFYIDALNMWVIIIITTLYLAATWTARNYLTREERCGVLKGEQLQTGRYFALMQLFCWTMFIVLLVKNLGLMWVAIEATTLISALLISFKFTRAALEATWKYIMVCTVGICLALLGTLVLYYAQLDALGGEKALSWLYLHEHANSLNPAMTKLALLFIVIGYGTKAGMAPMHTWLPDAYAQEVSRGKDTLSGHWEISGVPVKFDWGYFPDVPKCFPQELVDAIISQGNLPGVLGECHASGTEIIKELGEEHVRSGKPIIYTSADSVLQIAAHEEAFGLERLYDLCKLAFKLVQPYNIARVIARPFVGTCAADFTRTTNRHDYAVPAPQPTLLDKMVAAGGSVYAVGKIADIFAHRGITKHYAAGGLDKLVDATKQAVSDAPDNTIVFTNFVDFDSSYGHRRDIQGYGEALEYFDSRLPEITALLRPDDLLLMTADHGNDPSWSGTDHTREKIPVLFSGAGIECKQLKPMQTFADIGQTIADYMKIEPTLTGTKADLF